ncbi:MAG TPA: hypothetical protein VHB77_11710 [Planctomycetaceae bacterium]|nr:hypothetical protein [Planctomycetaceae bacterium]
MTTAPSTTPRGRWLLRGMIAAAVLLLLFGLLAPWLRVRWAAAQLSRYHARAEFSPSAIKALDDFTYRRGWVGVGSVVAVTRNKVPLTRRETEQLVRLLRIFPDLHILELSHSQLAESDFEVLSRMRKLENLTLCGSSISGSELDRLASCTQLCNLDLTYVHFDQELIDALGRLRQLKRLHLYGSHLAGLDLSPLCQLTNLRQLLLDHAEVTDAELATLACLPKLEELSLSGNGVSDEAINRLRERVPIENYSDD